MRENPLDCAPILRAIASKIMIMSCHRCGSGLSASDLFCPTCGSPQVRFEPEAEGEAAAYPSQRPTRMGVPAQGIAWRDAILAALLVGVPSGILSAVSLLDWGWCLWIVGGAVLCIGLYRKRAPSFHLNLRFGLRIGALAGVIAAYTSTATTAIWRVFARFVLHQGSAIDKFYDTVIQESFHQQSTLLAQTPDAQAQMNQILHFFMTPDGRATYALMYSAMAAAAIVIFSALGGALGVRLYSGRKAAVRNS
jgi:hypothetical protein